MKAIDYEAENTKRVTALELTGGPAHGGLTVLDWFAGKALEGLFTGDYDLYDWEKAVRAYEMAELMLAERKKRNAAAPVVTGVTGKHYG